MDMIGGIELVIMNDFIDLDDLLRLSKTNKYFNNHPYVKNRISRHINGIKTCFDIVSEHEDINSWGSWGDTNKVYAHEYWSALFYYNYNYNLNANIRSNVLDPYQLACYYSYFIRNYYYKKDIYFRDSYINVDSDGDSCKYGDNYNANSSTTTTTKIWNKNGDRSWIDRDTKNGGTYTYSKWSCIAYPDGYIKALPPRNGDPLVMSPYDSEVKITFIVCYKEESRPTELCGSCIQKEEENSGDDEDNENIYICYISKLQNVDIQYHYNFKTNWGSKIYIHPLFLKHCLKDQELYCGWSVNMQHRNQKKCKRCGEWNV